MRIVVLLLLASIITGCATTSGLQPTVGYSGFDNAKTVSISPHGNACKSMTCTGIGAQWNSSRPDSAILIIQVFNQYSAISGAELNIDGNKISLSPIRGVTDFSSVGAAMKESSKGFATSLSVVEQILSAKRVWLRVHTPTGYIEDAVIEGDKDSKAYHALSRFITAVKS